MEKDSQGRERKGGEKEKRRVNDNKKKGEMVAWGEVDEREREREGRGGEKGRKGEMEEKWKKMKGSGKRKE